MKKLVLLITAALLFNISYSQHFGVQAGGVLSNMQWENNILIVKTNPKPGFAAGVTVDFPLNESMLINTTLNYKRMGTSIKDGLWIGDSTEIYVLNSNYINLDITYSYIFNVGDLELFAEAGPYLSYAFSGKSTYTPVRGEVYTEDLKIGTEKTDDIKPIDTGFIIGAGIYFNRFKFGLGYQHGLLNLSTADTDEIARNRMGYLKVAYLFNR